MQRRRLKTTKPLLAHSTRACQYIKYICCVPYEALRAPGGTLTPGHTNCLIFSVPNTILFGFIFSDFCLSSFSHNL